MTVSTDVPVGARSGYRGPDRRELIGRSAPVDGATAVLRRPLHALVVLLVAGGVVLAAQGLGASGGMPPALDALATALAGAASTLAFLRWRVLGDAPAGLFGVAFLVYGLGALIPEALPTGGGGAVEPDLGRVVALIVMVVVCAATTWLPQVDTSLPVSWWAGGAALLVAVGLAVSLVDTGQVSSRWWAGVVAGLAMAMAGTAVLVHARLHERTATADWAATTLLTLAVAEGFQVLALLHDAPWSFGFATARAGALLSTLVGGIQDLEHAHRLQRVRLYGTVLDREMEVARRDADELLRARREHDIRSSITAIDGATTVLNRYAERLDEGARAQLQDAITAQIARLQRLVGDGAGDDLSTVSLASTVSPVLSELHLHGLTVHEAIPHELQVRARAADLAAVVRTVVQRTGRGGGEVEVSATRDDGTVVLQIRPTSERAAEADEHALDLTVCERLMQLQGGSLRQSPSTGAFELVLPAVEA